MPGPADAVTWRQTRAIIEQDLRRRGDAGLRNALLDPAFRFVVILRAGRWLRGQPVWLQPLSLLVRLWMLRARHRLGYDIPSAVAVGPGLLLSPHPGGIVVNPATIIGRSCSVSHGVTLGRAYGGRHPGVPTLGDRVYVGPGAKVIGGIRIGDDVAIGANSVVTSDVTDMGVVAGVPARRISEKGSAEYIRYPV